MLFTCLVVIGASLALCLPTLISGVMPGEQELQLAACLVLAGVIAGIAGLRDTTSSTTVEDSLEQSSDAMILLNLEGQIVRLNKKMADLWHTHVDHMLTQPLADAVNAELWDAIEAKREALLQGSA